MHNVHVPCFVISHVTARQRELKEEFLDETPENGEEQTEYLDEEYEEDLDKS